MRQVARLVATGAQAWRASQIAIVDRHDGDEWTPSAFVVMPGSADDASVNYPIDEVPVHDLTAGNIDKDFYFRAPKRPGRYRVCLDASGFLPPAEGEQRRSLIAEFRVR